MKFENIGLNAYMTGIFTYKVIFKLLPSATVIFFTKREEEHDHFTRASKDLSNQCARTNYRRFSLTCRGPIVWNNILNNICDLRTFAQFNSAWRKHRTYV